MATFAMTYDIVTDESAAQGDYAESGFHTERTEIGCKPGQIRLKTAIRLGRNEGCCQDNGDGSFYGDSEQNYRTGDGTSYAVHFEGLTPSTLKRVAKALGAKR